jgi:hypothetical protein
MKLLETLKSKVTGLAQIGLDAAYKVYGEAVKGIESLRMQMLVNEDSPYQVALKQFREAKVTYLNYREEVATMEQTEVTEDVLALLNSYQKVVDSTEEALLGAGKTANTALDTAKAQVKTAYETVVGLIETASVKANDYLSEISTQQQTAKEQFFTDFETNYAAAIAGAKNDWSAMKTELRKSGTTQEQA